MNPESTTPGEATEMEPRGASASPPRVTALTPSSSVLPAPGGVTALGWRDEGQKHKDGDSEGTERRQAGKT